MMSLNQLKQLEVRKWFILGIAIFVSGIALFLGQNAKPVFASEPIAVSSIIFSQDSLVTKQAVKLTLTLKKGLSGTIRYSMNGDTPNALSIPYTGTITIDKPTVIRARAFNEAGVPLGEIQTKSYIIANYEQTIPVVSIASDWIGLNALHNTPEQRGIDWERPINMEYFTSTGKVEFNVLAGIRIHGGFSRKFSPKKSYRLYFRKSYGGPGKLEYPLFADSTVKKFDKLVLRAGSQDTFLHRNIPGLSDKHATAKYIGDQVTRNLHQAMGQPIAHGSWVLLYLNGEFWGLYNLTERIDMDFLKSYSSKESDWDVIAKEGGWENGVWFNREEAKEGGDGAWIENQNWVGSADFSNPGNIGVLEWRVDVENVFSYLFLEAYVQNTDWPDANWIVYRRKDPAAIGHEAQWRMIVWDAEISFGSGDSFHTDTNTLERAYSPHDSITRILEKPFISSCSFKSRFVQRAREYLGVENLNGRAANEVGQLSKGKVKAEVLKQATIVRPFMQLEINRWAPDLNVSLFDQNITNTLRFVDERQEVILDHLNKLKNQTFTQCK